MHDSADCPVCGGRPVNGWMTVEEFFALVERCRAETAGKQPVFLERIRGAERWAYELTVP